jgi:transcriptional regulator GlxA family with amidase domain
MPAHAAAHGSPGGGGGAGARDRAGIPVPRVAGALAGTLRALARPEGWLAQIWRTIQWIHERYTEPFRVEQIAAMVDMSVAAFYRHFKAVTAMTPIQYQKRLRLLRARWLLLLEPRDAASIAFSVGMKLHRSSTAICAHVWPTTCA